MKVTHALVQLAAALVAEPSQKKWGYDLSKKSGVRSGAMYPRLKQMLEKGWLTDGWETDVEGRPARRYYQVTDDGLRELGALLARAELDARFQGLNLGMA